MNIINTRLNEERIAYEEEIRQLKTEVERLRKLLRTWREFSAQPRPLPDYDTLTETDEVLGDKNG